MIEDETKDRPDFEVDPSRLHRHDQPTAGQQGGLGISREDWLNVQDVARTPQTATPVTTAGTPGTGQTGVETPQASLRGGSNWVPAAASARAVLAKRVLMAEEIRKEFELQPGTGATPTTVKLSRS
jgi:hypothetical protein